LQLISCFQFTNSTVTLSTNGPRIKSNFNATGYIANITYSNILLSSISDYGIDVQQDYLNGGPNGTPSNGVKIENVLFQNVTGTVLDEGRNYYVLCGDGSCSGVKFEETKIIGGGKASSCNQPVGGCPN
jgi:polygalacturonase